MEMIAVLPFFGFEISMIVSVRTALVGPGRQLLALCGRQAFAGIGPDDEPVGAGRRSDAPENDSALTRVSLPS